MFEELPLPPLDCTCQRHFLRAEPRSMQMEDHIGAIKGARTARSLRVIGRGFREGGRRRRRGCRRRSGSNREPVQWARMYELNVPARRLTGWRTYFWMSRRESASMRRRWYMQWSIGGLWPRAPRADCIGGILPYLRGVVGEEYFMTRGHFHARRDRAEYYSTVSGNGMLVLMDEQRRASVQIMEPGTTHYIPGSIAHRVVNTGDCPLRFLACWPSDAGHDYATIDEQGFSLRVVRRDGRPELVAQT
jgi:mannose-6-phosphate isomerase-like protein (cupin superfamily)